MKVNVKIAGTVYTDIPCIMLSDEQTKIKMIDTSDTTAKPEDVAVGKTFYDSNGDIQLGRGSIYMYEDYDEFEF